MASSLPETPFEGRVLDTITSMLMATHRFALSLGDAPAEVTDEEGLPDAAALAPPPDDCSRREVRASVTRRVCMSC